MVTQWNTATLALDDKTNRRVEMRKKTLKIQQRQPRCGEYMKKNTGCKTLSDWKKRQAEMMVSYELWAMKQKATKSQRGSTSREAIKTISCIRSESGSRCTVRVWKPCAQTPHASRAVTLHTHIFLSSFVLQFKFSKQISSAYRDKNLMVNTQMSVINHSSLVNRIWKWITKLCTET